MPRNGCPPADGADHLDKLPPDQPIPMQQGVAAREENTVMPLDLDVMTYAR